MKLKDVIADAITRIAQHACRQGEAGSRAWPKLRQLPSLESWKMVGQQYAPEVLEEIAAMGVSGGQLTLDLEKDSALTPLQSQRAIQLLTVWAHVGGCSYVSSRAFQGGSCGQENGTNRDCPWCATRKFLRDELKIETVR